MRLRKQTQCCGLHLRLQFYLQLQFYAVFEVLHPTSSYRVEVKLRLFQLLSFPNNMRKQISLDRKPPTLRKVQELTLNFRVQDFMLLFV